MVNPGQTDPRNCQGEDQKARSARPADEPPAWQQRLPNSRRPILIEVAAGDLIDRLTILELKAERIRDIPKLENINAELATLRLAFVASIEPSPALDTLTEELRRINTLLWDVEDEIRGCERAGDLGPRFVALARQVCKQNDRRAAVKRQINELVGSRFREEKSYDSIV